MFDLRFDKITLYFSTLIFLTLLIQVLLFSIGETSQYIFTILTLSIVSLTVYILIKKKSGLLLAYLSYLTLTHLGIGIVELFSNDPFKNFSLNLDWYNSLYKNKAQIIASLAVSTFCMISVLIHLTNFNKSTNNEAISLKRSGNILVYYFGILLNIYFIIYFIYITFTGRISLFGNYQNFVESLQETPFYGESLFLFAIGTTFIFSSGNKNQILKALPFFLFPALLLLITGNRGEVFYPLASSVGVLITRGLKINTKLLLTIIVCFFLIIPLVKEMRGFDLNQVSGTEISVGIKDPFLEIGYTLRPLVFVVGWVENGEEIALGESYIFPFQRGIANFIPGIEKASYEGKGYNFRERLPTMGFSVVAEAYYNFHIFGIFIVMSIITILLGAVGDRANNFNRLIFISAFNAVLLNNIRNAFSFVPGQLVMLLLIFITIKIIYFVLKKKDLIKVI
ncbi:MAG: O-antigen polysaccharide polymerase Wzy family protein [Bacillaceae bacterium]|nr:O-antigen polysaccharide polymerase Wzy family protein [Bacillaceae bacterium]